MFKPGRSRGKRLVLDIGSSAIRLCQLSSTKTGYQLTKYYQRDLVNDPALDEQAKKKQRTEALKNLLKEAKVRRRKTVIAVPGRSVFTRTRTLPPVPEYKVTQIVKYEIQQQIPFALDQISLDYQILSRTESGGYDVMMAAIKVDVVDKQTEILRDVNRAINTVDVSPIAAYNWIKHCGEFGTTGECVALLDMGASTTDIIIERGGQFRFTRPLNLGGDDITAAISATFNVSFADAERAKRQRAFAPTGDPKQDGKLGETVGQVLTRLVNEINRSFGYFRSLPGGGTVDRVVITGGGACLRNIAPYLNRQLGLEVRIARPLAGIAVAPGAQEANEHPEQAAVVLGMALRCCEQVPIEVNLIPPRVLEAARRKEQVAYWILSFIVLGVIAALVIPANEEKDKQVRGQIQKLEQCLQMYDPSLVKNPDQPSKFLTELEDEKALLAGQQAKLDDLSNAYGHSRFWLAQLQTLNELRVKAGKIWFSSVETSVIRQGREEGGAPGPRRGFGGANRGAAASRTGVDSTGFPGLEPGGMRATGSEGMGGRIGRNRERGPGPGNREPAGQAASAAPPPPMPNGLRVFAYAKDPESIAEFISLLKGAEMFKAGVHWNEATIEKVPITELDNARVAESPGGAATGNTGNTGRAGHFSGLTRNNMPAPAAVDYGDTVLFFRVDVQFGAAPRAAERRDRESSPMAGAMPASSSGDTTAAAAPMASAARSSRRGRGGR